jgi:hypothetical protein
MANWTGAARSNYVKFVDVDKLKEVLKPFDIEVSANDNGDGTYCLLSKAENGDWPGAAPDPADPDEWIDFNPVELICPHLQDGEVLVLMEAGHEKLRYVSGWAGAYTANGSHVVVNLMDIYDEAAKAFGVPVNKITAAEY